MSAAAAAVRSGLARSGGGAMARPSAVVIAGPSGVGKGTLVARLREENPAAFGFCVSHTTRAPRPGEADGVQYHFVALDEMRAAVARGEFVEHADVHGRMYGTSRGAVDAVAAAGRVAILEIDVQGCRQVRKAQLDAKFIFIAPPSMEELERRLRGRGTEAEESVKKRLEGARAEMEARDEPGLFDRVIVNADLDKAYAELRDALQDEITRGGGVVEE